MIPNLHSADRFLRKHGVTPAPAIVRANAKNLASLRQPPRRPINP